MSDTTPQEQRAEQDPTPTAAAAVPTNDIAEAVKTGDKTKLKSIMRQLLDEIDSRDVTPEKVEKEKEDKAFSTQSAAAEVSRRYRAGAFARSLPTQPEIPEPVDYSKILGHG